MSLTHETVHRTIRESGGKLKASPDSGNKLQAESLCYPTLRHSVVAAGRGHARQNAFFPGAARHAENPM
jgi:hypothetical protein